MTTRKTPSKPAAKSPAKASTKVPAKTTHHTAKVNPSISTASVQPAVGIPVGTPVFAEPSPTPDPTKYTTPHASDTQAYNEMDQLIKESKFLPLPFPIVPNTPEPILTLAAALGPHGASTVTAIQNAGQIVFHSAGDTGATRGPNTENQVVDKLVSDFTGEAAAGVPQFFYNLGDIVYSFGEHKYYYDQFYDAYRDYPGPIFAIPGNHDGIVLPAPAGTGDPKSSLSAFLTNFCAPGFAHSPDAVGISRTTMIQPGVYFTFEAPFVRILGIYSNILENPGVISSTVDPSTKTAKFPNIPDVQLDYLRAALTRIKTDNFQGAILISVHHPPYAFGKHTGSLVMLKEIDAICQSVGIWPHAFLSGHAHNYQRFTRTIGGRQIPFMVIGNGGHGIQKLSKGTTIRTPQSMPVFAQPEAKDTVTFESYDDANYGYTRILINAQQLRIEYHPASDGTITKTPDDSVTVDLASHTLVHYDPPS
jgi:hypothetical protein